jgi:Transcriptional Coactivator p15 (PC4)
MDPIVISEFPKNKTEDFRLSLTEYQGHNLIDFRIYFKDKQGESKPTKKGVTVNVKLFPQLKQAIMDAENILKEKEML